MPRSPLPIGTYGEISMQRSASGRWQAYTRYRDIDGKTRVVKANAPTKGSARTRLIEKLAVRKHVSTPVFEISLMTRIKTVAEYWLEKQKSRDIDASTYRTYDQSVRLHILPLLGELTLGEVTPAQVDVFLRTVEKRRTMTRTSWRGEVETIEVGGKTSKKHARTSLAMMMDMCRRFNAIDSNPVEAVKAERDLSKKPVKVLTIEEIPAIRRHITAWGQVKASGPSRPYELLLDFIDLLVATGCRPNEVLALRWEDVDLLAGTVSISGTMSEEKAAGGYHRKDAPKTQAGFRTLTLPAWGRSILRNRANDAQDLHGPVFRNRSGGYLRLSALHKNWRHARAGGWEHVSFDAYRKAVATMIERAQGMEAAAAQLGHASTEITRKYYVERNTRVDNSRVMGELGL